MLHPLPSGSSAIHKLYDFLIFSPRLNDRKKTGEKGMEIIIRQTLTH
jgi:hypothetical protein